MKALRLALTGLLAGVAWGCDQPDMRDQPKLETYEASDYFEDAMAARQPPAHTVSRAPSQSAPPPVSLAFLQRGRQHYAAVCAPCHGYVGEGHGMVIQRGFPAPPSFHSPKLRAADDDHFYRVITRGYGVMYSYADRLPPGQRWAVIAYIRALQLSQHAPAADLPKALQKRLTEVQTP